MATTPDPAPSRPANPWALLAVASAFGLSWFLLVAAARAASPLQEFSDQWWPQASIWRLIVGVLAYLVIAPLLLRRWLGGRWRDWTGLRLPRGAQWMWAALLLAAAIVPALTVQDGGDRMAAEWATPFLVLVALQPPLVEEVLMRGIFVRLLDEAGFGRWVTTLLGAALFASWHVASFGWSQGLITGLVSIPFFFVPRYLSGGVVVTIALHGIANAGALNGVGILALVAVEAAAGVVALVGARRRRRARRRASATTGDRAAATERRPVPVEADQP